MRDSARSTVVFLTTALVLHGLLLWPFISDTRFDFDAVHLYFPLATELLAEGLKFFSAERSLQAPPFSYIYPALLGATLPAVKHANFVISFVTLLLVFRVAWLAHSRVAAIAAALLFAASPLLRPFLAAPLTEPPFLLLCGAWIWALGEWFASGRRIFPVIAGIALGLAILTRGTLFYLPVLLVVVFAWLGWRRSAEIQQSQARGAAAAHLIALLFPLVFIAKNWLLFSFAFFATGAGNALYLGNNPLTGGYDPVYLGILFDVGSIVGSQTHLMLAGEHLLGGVARMIVGEQGTASLVQHHAMKLTAFLFVTNAEISDHVLVLRSWRIGLMVFAVVGAIAVRRSVLGWVLVGTVLYQVAVHVPVLYTHRYSVGAIDLWLVILAAAGVGHLWMRHSVRQWAAVAAALGVGLAAGAYVHRYSGPPEPDVFRAARLLVWEGEPVQRRFVENQALVQIPVRGAPRFHPWANHVLVMEAALSSSQPKGVCGWMRLSYKRDGDPGFSAIVSRHLKPDGNPRLLQVGAVIPMRANAEGVLQVKIECEGGGVLDLRRVAIYAPMGSLDYRARFLGEPQSSEFERGPSRK